MRVLSLMFQNHFCMGFDGEVVRRDDMIFNFEIHEITATRIFNFFEVIRYCE